MTEFLPNINPLGNYPIGRAAQMLGIDRSTLRRYARTGRVKFSLRSDNCRMYFKGRDLIKLYNTTFC